MCMFTIIAVDNGLASSLNVEDLQINCETTESAELPNAVAMTLMSPLRMEVRLDEPTYWRTQTGERFVARYGNLSDNSLRFVQVTMPEGRELILPQSGSASGTRYTDDCEFVWWEHHGEVRVDVRLEDGSWDENHWSLQAEVE